MVRASQFPQLFPNIQHVPHVEVLPALTQEENDDYNPYHNTDHYTSVRTISNTTGADYDILYQFFVDSPDYVMIDFGIDAFVDNDAAEAISAFIIAHPEFFNIPVIDV